VRCGGVIQLLRGLVGFGNEAGQLNQQAAGNSERIVLLS
jgi:hypothetical protein